ncbi:plasmid segregation protein ParM [Bacillus spongiae]|uniref:Plasmid segregation protein ParM n=1 Tax=Bacillus spongiae TaxID=2683610 RepID=A0ABU8HJA4_9BACI
MSNKRIVIGLDHGNGWVKAKTDSNMVVLPSYIARKDSLGEGLTGGKLELNEFESSTHKGEVYVWGKDVVKAERPLSTYGSQNRYQQKYYKLLNQFALAKVLGNYTGDVVEALVITGIPSQEKGTELEKDLESTLRGSHLVKVDGKEIIIKVTKVVIVPQPVGTLMSQYLDNDGFVKEESYEEDAVAVIDVGTGTTDLDHIKELRRQTDDFDSIKIGMFDVYKKISDFVNRQNPSANATPQKVEEQFENGSYTVSKRSKIDITGIKEDVLETVAMDIKNSIIQRWRTWDRFDEIIITGGGATPLGQKLKELIGDATPIKEAQIANAEGFYKYGKFIEGASK